MRRMWWLSALLAVVVVTACGGGGSSDDASADRPTSTISRTVTTTLPPTTTTLAPYAVAALGGKPCTPEGATQPPVNQGVGYSVPYSNHGLRCTAGIWTWIVDVNTSCSSNPLTSVPAIVADGRKPTCISNRWLLDGQTITAFYEGTYRVGTGTGQVEPGVYRADGGGMGVKDCYWERVDSSGGTIANDFVLGAPQIEVTVDPSDFGLTVRGPCGQWTKVG